MAVGMAGSEGLLDKKQKHFELDALDVHDFVLNQGCFDWVDSFWVAQLGLLQGYKIL